LKRFYFLSLIFAAPLLLAQQPEIAVTFKQQLWGPNLVFVGSLPSTGWHTIPAKDPNARASLKLLARKEGQSRLEWHESTGRLELHNAKGPADSQGNISMDTGAILVVLTKSSVAVRDLKSRLSLSPGYYAVRVTAGPFNNSSDWITLRIN
jgi:hypothetical protein